MYQRLLLNLQARINQKQILTFDNELSYESLREQGLIHTKTEYISIKNTFENSSDNKYTLRGTILKWLRDQNQRFRHSYLSHILISGYARVRNETSIDLYIPIDIQNIILSYTHIIFMKLYRKYNDDTHQIRTFNANLTISNLFAMLEYENNELFGGDNFIRIWLRFGVMKFIYLKAIKTHNTHNTLNIETDKFVNEDNNRWFEFTNNNYELTINEIDRYLSHDEILEIGVDIYDSLTKTYTFRDQKPGTKTQSARYNRLNWICSLKLGDIINVKHTKWAQYAEWCEAFVVWRDFDSFYVCCIEDNSIRAVQSIGKGLDGLQPRYTHCKYTWHHRARGIWKRCDWITEFTKHPSGYNIVLPL